ncbi:hypothetical protein Cgig2_006665 [Carnegiea gigantea]|uniref:Uncharacterized protein n=1 Tax=Carnegiea gigantea TaxID=171969 RepID=A0A9Q1JZ50_9CARY|nr:hypothetical protein Cgig2_006665 [Carnegiea gigantea]
MATNFEDFEAIFGEAKAEWETTPSNPECLPLNPFLFRVFAADPSQLRFHATDFGSYTWEATRSLHQLEDMRDSTGIGGSWLDFMNYVISSLRSKDVKLVLEWRSNSNGAKFAKLVARKSKGLPLISISLSKLSNPAASEAMASLSLELFKAYTVLHDSFIRVGSNTYSEQERCCQLSRVISAEKEKSQAIKRKLDAAMHSESQRSQKTSDMGNIASPFDSDTSSVTAAVNSSEKQPAADGQSTKVTSRAVPAYRRAKVRGAVLHDTEDEEGS